MALVLSSIKLPVRIWPMSRFRKGESGHEHAGGILGDIVNN